jgi:hypothetical protein
MENPKCLWCNDSGIVWVRVGSEDDYDKDACTMCDSHDRLCVKGNDYVTNEKFKD